MYYPLLIILCSKNSGLESGSSLKPQPGETSNFRKPSLQNKSRARWDYSSVIADMLKFYAEQVGMYIIIILACCDD